MLLAVLLTTTPVALAASHTMTIPEPDHGLTVDEFYPLWSEDDDLDGNLRDINASSEQEWFTEAIQRTDWTYSTPPIDIVEQWNSGDHRDFTEGAPRTSRIPQNTDVTNEQYIKDAYVRVFSVTPSTVVHTQDQQSLYDRVISIITPGDPDSKAVQLIGSDGTVRAITDYRVDLPSGSSSSSRRVSWSIDSHRVEDTRLYVDGDQHAQIGASHTPSLQFDDVDAAEKITVETTVRVTLKKTVKTRSCETLTNGDGQTYRSCSWSTSTSTYSDSAVVRDTIDVQVESLSGSGTYVEATEGHRDTYILESNSLWSRMDFSSDSSIITPWRFYTKGTTDWGMLTERSATGSTAVISDSYPVTVHAFPSDRRLDVNRARLTEQAGSDRAVPSLPDNINVNVAEGTYEQPAELTVETYDEPSVSAKVYGLVHNTPRTIPLDQKHREQTITTLTVEEVTASNVTVTASVTDGSGVPISDGKMEIAGEKFDLPANGTVTETVSRPDVSISAEYLPPKALTGDLYATSSDSESLSTPLPPFNFLINVAVATFFWAGSLYGLVYGYRVMAGTRGGR